MTMMRRTLTVRGLRPPTPPILPRTLRAARSAILATALALGALTLSAGCDYLNAPPTKVASGQLYQSGDARYDAYFDEVHKRQVAAASWPDDSKTARKPIIAALNLRPGASNATIFTSAREKKSDASIGQAVSETTSAERELARKLTAEATSLEDLQKRGEELKKQAVEERKNLGVDKADEEKVKKKDEVKREITAAVDVVNAMLDDAQHGAKEADELARKLRGAWTGSNEEETGDAPKEEARKDDGKDRKDEAKKPAAKKPAAGPKPAAAPKPAAEKAATSEKPAPAEKPATKPADEVFNP